ncbi:MAG: patatin-like phospholipase family protein, partial [Pseudomonadota bacterium]
MVQIGEVMKKFPTYAVFEGGGAIGVCHVGVLRALQRARLLELKGYAGTSAGALVATLAAAGVSGEQMIDKTDGKFTSVLNLLDDEKFRNAPYKLEPFESAKDLIGPGRGWLFITMLRYLASSAEGLWSKAVKTVVMLVLFAAIVAIFIAPGPVTFMLLDWLTWSFRLLAALGVGLVPFLVAIYLFSRFRGIAKLERAEDALYALIRAKMEGTVDEKDDKSWLPDYREPITFELFESVFKTKLKIVATDLDDKKLTLFSSRTTPNACVVKATIASIAIPIAFRPQRVALDSSDPHTTRVFADGGLVSNLPTWSFEPEIKEEPESRIVTSELHTQSEAKAADRSLGALLSGVLRSAVFGSASLGELRIPANVIRVFPRGHELDVLDIDASADSIVKAARKSQITAEAVIGETVRIQRYITSVREEVGAAILASTGSSELPQGSDFQVAIAREDRLNDTPNGRFSLRHFSGFAEVFRLRHRQPLQEAAAQECVFRGRPFIHVFRDPSDNLALLQTDSRFVRLPVKNKLDLFQREPPDVAWIAAVETDFATADEDLISVVRFGFEAGIKHAMGHSQGLTDEDWRTVAMPKVIAGRSRRKSVLVLQGNTLFGA